MTQKQSKNEFWAWFKVIGLTIIMTMGVRYFILSPVVVKGASMEPTFENGDKIIVNKVGPRISSYDRFDVIVFETKEDKNYIKRIIGLPGDHIAYKDDVLYINGKAFEEPYLTQYKEALLDKGDFTYDFTLEEQLGEKTVPSGHFFVLGDNRRVSIDSRSSEVGFVSQDKILGTADFLLWPFERLGSTR